MNKAVMHETSVRSLDGTMSFPEVVQKLLGIGVESYNVHLIQNRKTFYMPNGEFYSDDFSVPHRPVADKFSAEAVVSAIRSSQARKITYLEFLNLIRDAGVTNYNVFINGRKAIYFGRNGEFHVENFPSS